MASMGDGVAAGATGEYRLGVDLGTTFTAAAIRRGDQVQMVTLGMRSPEIPSVIAITDDEILVGDAAERRALVDPGSIAREFKRRIGDPTPLIVNSAPWSAEALTGRLLAHVLDHVKLAEGEPPARITVTHPANWHHYKLDHFRQALLLAGCEDAELVPEPVAAAHYYAVQGRISPGQQLAVFDFGGGTLDTALVHATSRDTFALVGQPKGLERLGGVDLDYALFAHVLAVAEIDLDTLEDTKANRQAVGRLRSDCRDAKEYLSVDTSTAIPIMLPSPVTEVRINRTEFEGMIRQPLTDATSVMAATIREAGLDTTDIDGVLLVGGTSRIPIVSQIIGEQLRLPVFADAHPKHSIAAGATLTPTRAEAAPESIASPPAPPEEPPPREPEPPSAPTQHEQDVEPPGHEVPVTTPNFTPDPDATPPTGRPGPTVNRARRGPRALLALVVLIAVAAVAVGVVTLVGGDGDQDVEPPVDAADTDADTEIEGADPEPEEPAAGGQDTASLVGTEVVITGPQVSESQVVGIQAALDAFGQETGINVSYIGSVDWEAEVIEQIDAGTPPDISLFFQPSKLADFARADLLRPLPDDVLEITAENWSEAWTVFGNVDGTQFGIPVSTDVKSLVWYKPELFARKGYPVPTTFDEFLALTDVMITNGDTPLCVGIESGGSTGWVYTDWVEDLMLRFEGPEPYDQWVSHEIPFDDPRVVTQMQAVLDLWNTRGMVFAAGGTIGSTSFFDNATPLFDEACMMHRQASFFARYFEPGTPFGPEGVDVFYLPSNEGTPALVAGNLVAAFTDRPEVWAVMAYMSGPVYAERRQIAQREFNGGGVSGFLSAVRGLDRNVFTPLEQGMLDILVDASVVRFDASDLMPVQVGAGTFWTEGTAAVNGEQDAQRAANSIEASWPD